MSEIVSVNSVLALIDKRIKHYQAAVHATSSVDTRVIASSQLGALIEVYNDVRLWSMGIDENDDDEQEDNTIDDAAENALHEPIERRLA